MTDLDQKRRTVRVLEWGEYVSVNQEGLARMEAEEAGT